MKRLAKLQKNYDGADFFKVHFEKSEIMLDRMISSDASSMSSPFTKALDLLSLPRRRDLACLGNEADP